MAQKKARTKSRSKNSYDEKKFRNTKDDSTDTSDSYRKGRNSRANNDASWYTGNQQLAKDAGNYSFTWPVGNPVELELNKGVSGFTNLSYKELMTDDGTEKFALPGVMAIRFTPTAGISTDNTSVLNLAAHNIYTFVRHANSGHSNYDAPDLMLYLMAMDQIYMIHSAIRRLYGTLALTSQRNRNLPRLLVEAQGFDYDDLVAHMSDLRYYLNQITLKINSFAVPSTMSYFKRHYWMCENVYADANDPKAQYYVFVPAAYGKYQETSGAGYLSAEFFSDSNGGYRLTFADIQSKMDDLLNAVMYSEDMNIMSGDILKAYGEGSLFAIPQVPTDYVVIPQYNLEVLGQIHNTTLAGVPAFPNGKFIDQDPNTNALLSTVYFSRRRGIVDTGKRIMSAFSMSPTEDEVLVNSRLMVVGDTEYSDASGASYPFAVVGRFDPASVGSEVACFALVYRWKVGGTVEMYHLELSMITRCMVGSTNAVGTTTKSHRLVRSILSAFNYHPMIYWHDAIYSSNPADVTKYTTVSVYIDFDVDNYSIVDAHDIAKMHETSLLSLFDVPQMGR